MIRLGASWQQNRRLVNAAWMEMSQAATSHLSVAARVSQRSHRCYVEKVRSRPRKFK